MQSLVYILKNKITEHYVCNVRGSQTAVDEDSSIMDCPEIKAADYVSVISLPVAMISHSNRCEVAYLQTSPLFH